MPLLDVLPFRMFLAPWGTTNFGTLTADAAGEKVAYIIQVPKSGNIDRVCFRTGTITTGGNVTVSIETIDGTGAPSGTLWGTNTSIVQNVLSANDDLWFEVTLTAAAVVAKGDFIAVVITPVTGFNGDFSRMSSSPSSIIPYTQNYTGSWVRGSQSPIGAIRYSDGSYGHVPGLLPWSTYAATTFNSGTTPDERGNKITVPYTCKVVGIWFFKNTTLGGDVDFKLYDIADAVLASKSVDGDIIGTVALPTQTTAVYFGSEVLLMKGQVVRATLTPTTVTSMTLMEGTFPTGLAAAAPSGGAHQLTTRVDGGAWTDTATKEAAVGLIVSAIDVAGASYGFVG